MILTVAIPTPLRRLFDYLPPTADETPEEPLKPGVRVRVNFGSRTLVGLVVGHKADSDQAQTRLKPVLEVLDDTPLFSPPLLDLFLWAVSYYQHPVGDALFNTLPALLRRGAPLPDFREEYWRLTARGLGLGESSLKRARKQRQLVALLQTRDAVATREIQALGFTRQTLRDLADKELVEAFQREGARDGTAPLLAAPPLSLRPEQARALAGIRRDGYSTTVLFGDTGTGKTEVYLQAIEAVLRAGRQALLLVPEINLTPQTVARFHARFNCAIDTLHSGMTDRERLAAWTRARAGHSRIVIGTRSAVFTPLPELGIIILDEEHDPSFKQQEGFRYSARDVAVMRASRADIPVVLGSATPSLESLHNCRQGRYQLQELRERNRSDKPAWRLVDLKGTNLQSGLAGPTVQAIREQLAAGHQVLVFLNRRGYAPVMLCHDCGWQALCQHCSTRMTAHLGSRRLICHHCETPRPLPATCPDCHGGHLVFSGQGTERCEETLRQLFPDVSVIRVDRDSTRRKGAMDQLLREIQGDKPAILLGTQMLAKGHHFPNVTLSVLLDADGGLFSADFRGTERTAQLIIQVAGRAGRGDAPGQVYLQSHYCDHPLIADLTTGDYRPIADKLLREREALNLPPYTHLACFRCDARRPEDSQRFLARVRSLAEQLMPPSAMLNYLGPLPGLIEKRRDHFRFTLVINSANRTRLSAGLRRLCQQLEEERPGAGIKWSLDVDPMDMS